MRTTFSNILITASILGSALAAPISSVSGIRPLTPSDSGIVINYATPAVETRSEFTSAIQTQDSTVIDDPLAGVRPQDLTIINDPLAGVRPLNPDTYFNSDTSSVERRSGGSHVDTLTFAGRAPTPGKREPGVAPDTPIISSDPDVTINYFGTPHTKRQPGVAPETPIIPNDPEVTINYFGAKRAINGLPGAYGRPKPGAQPVESNDVLLALLRKRAMNAML